MLACLRARSPKFENLPVSHRKMKDFLFWNFFTFYVPSAFYLLPLKCHRTNPSLIHWHQLDWVGKASVLQSVACLINGDKLLIGAIITSSDAEEFFSAVRWHPCSWSGPLLKWWEIQHFADFEMTFGCKSMTSDRWSDSLMLCMSCRWKLCVMCDLSWSRTKALNHILSTILLTYRQTLLDAS